MRDAELRAGCSRHPEYFFFECFQGQNAVFDAMSYQSPKMDKLPATGLPPNGEGVNVGITVAPEDIDEAYVRRATALMGIELTAAQVPGVIENFRRTAQAAAFVNAFELDPETDEIGPVWRP